MDWVSLTRLRIKTMADVVTARTRAVQACHLFGDHPLVRSKFGSAVSLLARHIAESSGGYIALEVQGGQPALRATAGPSSALRGFDPARLVDLVEHEVLPEGMSLTVRPPSEPISDAVLRSAGAHLARLAPDVRATASLVRENRALYSAIEDLDRETRRTTVLSHKLERRNDDLGMFASAASHDLREPIAIVKMYTTLMLRHLDQGNTDAAREAAQTVLDSAEHARSMLEGLSAYGRLADSDADMLPPLDPMPTIQRVLRVLSDRIESSGASVFVQEPVPPVRMSEEHLAQVLQNLVSNSLKFCDGAPNVLIAGEASRGKTRLWVQDKGIGIPDAARERVLRMFGRAHPDRPGTGVGLGLVSRIVEASGGRLHIDSEEGKGTKVTVELPWD